MSAFLAYTIVGVVTGCIYALAATGIVVTYTTTGIFNFSHGAIAMAAAFLYWQLWRGWGLPAPIALLLVLFVIAPVFGVIIERLLMRPLYGASVDVHVVVTLGLLLALVGAAELAWPATRVRRLPQFFNGHSIQVGFLTVTYNQILIVVLSAAIAVGLGVFFSRTRTGIALRAVVDNPALVAMAGGRPTRIQQLAWAIGCGLAALAGILLAPLTQLDILQLTLLVINGFAAAMIGRLRNLPLTVAGAIGIGLLTSYGVGYLPGGGFLSQIQQIIPMIVLFVVLVILPQDRLRSGSLSGPVAPRPAGLGSSLTWTVILLVGAVLVSGHLSVTNLAYGANCFALAFILLSLTLLTGYGGLVSLCQLTFVGLGAFAMGHLGHGGSLLGVLGAVGLAAGFGVLVALPTLRLRGLYLALATLAFAQAMDAIFFNKVLGNGGAITVARVRIPGIPTQSDRAFFLLCAVVFAATSIGLLALRRGPFGRRLAALNDSPAACATLGVNTNWTKLIVFTMSAALAGIGGVLYAGVTGIKSQYDFIMLLSLVILLLVRMGGINTASGALAGAFVYAVAFPLLKSRYPHLASLQYLLTGLAAISIGRDPNGIGGRIAGAASKLNDWRRNGPSRPVTATSGLPSPTRPAAEGELASAG